MRRSEFDHILLKNASASGAEVYEEHRVTDIQFDDGGADIVVTAADGTDQKWRAACSMRRAVRRFSPAA